MRMFCEKCGSQIEGNATFCPKCGTRISYDATPQAGQSKMNILKSKKPLIITLAIILAVAITATIIGVSVSSCKKNKSLEGMMTAHNWVFNWKVDNQIYNSQILEFNKDGTFIFKYIEYDGEGRIEEERLKEGSWTLSEDKTLSLTYQDDSERIRYLKWNTDVTDADCGQLLNSTKFREENADKDWYVSNSFFKIGYHIYTPQ